MLCDRVLFRWMVENVGDGAKCSDPRGVEYLRATLDELGVLLGGANAEDGAKKLEEIFTVLNLDRPKMSDEQIEILKNSVNPVRLKNHPIALDAETIEELYRKI